MLVVYVISKSMIIKAAVYLVINYIQTSPYSQGYLIMGFLLSLNLGIFIAFRYRINFCLVVAFQVWRTINEFDLISIEFECNCLYCKGASKGLTFMDGI